jgi:hypothetical protein
MKEVPMHTLPRSVLLLVCATALVLLGANPATTQAKTEFTYFAEAFSFASTDAAGIETSVEVVGIDYPTAPDEVTLQITRSNPACADPTAGCPYVLISGFVRAQVAGGDVRIQPNLRWARVATTITFMNEISGTSCSALVDLTWHSTSAFFPDGDNDQGFRQADAAGTVTCAGEEFLRGQVDTVADIARFILSS